MNPSAILVLSSLIASAAAVGVTFALRTEPAVQPTNTADVQRELADLRASNDKLQQRLEALANAPAPATSSLAADRSAAPAVSSEMIAAAVEAFLKKNGASAALGASGAAKPDAEPVFDLDAEMKKLGSVSYDEDPELWKRLHAAGKAKEALERFEALVKANPTDTAAHMQLANANLAYMRVVPSEYNLAIRADKAFDDVLTLDDKHWEARFTKAVSYSFWPPLTGKPKQAIGHLETLVSQQEAMPPQAHEAHTYLILGNLLEQSDSAKATEIWKKGARRHPDNADLANKAK